MCLSARRGSAPAISCPRYVNASETTSPEALPGESSRQRWFLRAYTRNRGLVILGVLALALPAEAIRLRTTWGQRVDLAKRIVLGHVTRVESAWNAGRTSINTYVTVNVEEQLKGSGPEELLIDVPGGTVGATTQWVSDVPHFIAGERYVILLTETGNVTNGPDGLFPMSRSDAQSFLHWLRAYVSGDPQAAKEGPRLGPGLPNR